MAARALLKAAPPVRVRPKQAPSKMDTEDNPILRLQQTAGNQVVQRLLSVQRDARQDAAHSERLSAALQRDDYAAASAALQQGDQHWMLDRLRSLSEDQLRRLDDAMRRAGSANTTAHRMVTAVLTQTVMQAGRGPEAAKPGATYGKIEGHAAQIIDGQIMPGATPNKTASYQFEISFMPDPKLVKATLIEFVQVARVVSTVTTEADPVGHQIPVNAGANGPNRQTSDHARVDRHDNRTLGWMGRQDDGNIQPGRLRPWTPGSTQPAWMNDTPRRDEPNVDFNYETSAICRQGPDAGMVYATVQWGFTIDANLKIIPKEPVYFNKESSDFDLSVAFWNAESSQPGSAQQPLPDNIH
jgi:hypothetical protein